eukprot:jgi/Orpsp1_1/1189121/evm.model.d7180000069627.1
MYSGLKTVMCFARRFAKRDIFLNTETAFDLFPFKERVNIEAISPKPCSCKILSSSDKFVKALRISIGVSADPFFGIVIIKPPVTTLEEFCEITERLISKLSLSFHEQFFNASFTS